MSDIRDALTAADDEATLAALEATEELALANETALAAKASQAALDAQVARITQSLDRHAFEPTRVPEQYSIVATADIATLGITSPAITRTPEDTVAGIGKEVLLTGEEILGSRKTFPVRAGGTYIFDWQIYRHLVSADPSGDGVEVRARFLRRGDDGVLSLLSDVLVASYTTGQLGLISQGVTVAGSVKYAASASADIGVVAWASGTNEIVLYVKTFGGAHKTAVPYLGGQDSTNYVQATLDVSTIQDAVDGLGETVDTLGETKANLAQIVARESFADNSAFLSGTSEGEYGYVGETLTRNVSGVATAVTADELAALHLRIESGIADGSVGNTKLANMPSLTLKGNLSGGAAAPVDVPVADLPIGDAAEARLTEIQDNQTAADVAMVGGGVRRLSLPGLLAAWVGRFGKIFMQMRQVGTDSYLDVDNLNATNSIFAGGKISSNYIDSKSILRRSTTRDYGFLEIWADRLGKVYARMTHTLEMQYKALKVAGTQIFEHGSAPGLMMLDRKNSPLFHADQTGIRFGSEAVWNTVLPLATRWLFLSTGQSNSLGRGPVLTSTYATDLTGIEMLDEGGINQDEYNDTPATDIVAAVQTDREIPLAAMVRELMYKSSIVARQKPVLLNVGKGGASVTSIGNATAPFINFVTRLAEAQGLSTTALEHLGVGPIIMMNGEADLQSGTMTEELFLRRMIQLRREHSRKAGLTGKDRLPMYTWQVSSHRQFDYAHSLSDMRIANAQLKAYAQGGIVPYAPGYFLAYADGVHHTNHGARHCAQYAAKAFRYWLETGQHYRPTRVVAVRQTGTRTVLAEMDMQVGNLQIETTRVTLVEHDSVPSYGVEVWDDNGRCGTAKVNIGPRHIEFVAEDDIVGTPYFCLAKSEDAGIDKGTSSTDADGNVKWSAVISGPTQGPRTNLTDEDTEVSSLIGADDNPYPLPNYALGCELPAGYVEYGYTPKFA